MKLIVEEKDGCAERVKIEYTTREALVLNQAMRLYVENDYVKEAERETVRKMLEVEPIFVDVSEDEE